MERTELLDFVRFFKAYLSIKPIPLASKYILTFPDIQPPTQLSHWVRVHLEGQGCGLHAPLSWSTLFSLVTDLTLNHSIQSSHRQLFKEESRKEYVDKKITVYQIPIKNTRVMTDRLVVSSVKDNTYYIQEYSN